MVSAPAEDKKDILELFRRYKETGSEEFRNELVEQHLYLARILASKYAGRGIDYDDLYQVAAYALLLAVERYDPDRGILFTSYATPTIIGEIKKYFRDTTWSLKVPRRLKEIAMRIPGVKEALQVKIGKIPTVQELAAEMDVSEEDILEALESSRAYSAYSLDHEGDESAEETSTPFEKYLGDDEDGYSKFELSGVIEKLMKELSDAEKAIVMKRFFDEMTQREVAESLGISQMTVSRIEKALREKFRKEYNR
ncbi:RNA polymerase sigma-B factor [Clostridia bacterium]|nr:RNA polymerase sigma-B factor [Clostridia bacterium]